VPHPIAETAREAYAIGWASTGGPLTDRVRAGCVAAVELAVEHADDPHVLEATLHLGKLEGTWAAVYDRREKLHVRNLAAVVTAWAAFGLRAKATDLVRAARLHAGLTETTGTDDWFTQLARSVIAQNLNVTGIYGLSDAIQAALIQAQAEGHAAAGALLAQQHDVVGFDFDIAFADAYRALQGASSLVGAAEVDGWLSKLLGDNADEVGSKLATMTSAGASYEDMVSAVSGILDGASSRSVATSVDVLTSRAVSQGALDLYRSDGLTHVDFLTAGSGNVCPICVALEAKNPYLLADAPRPSIHVFCRCALSPSEAAVTALTNVATTLGAASAADAAADVMVAADVSAADMATAAAWGTTAADIAAGAKTVAQYMSAADIRTAYAAVTPTDTEAAAVERYTLKPSQINAPLRGTGELTAAAQKTVDGVDSLMARFALPDDAQVFRGLRQGWDGFPTFGDAVGQVLHEPAYMSTSLDGGQSMIFAAGGNEPIFIEVRVPAGTHAIDVDAVAGLGEKELLLPRGGDLVITGEQMEGNIRFLTAEYREATAAEQADLERHIASGVARTQPLGGGLSADTSLVTFNDGTQAVLKVAKQYAERPPAESTDAEYLTGRLGQELGIRVPEVVRTADNTVYMGYVSDARTGMEAFDTGNAADRLAVEVLADTVEGRQLGLLDLVTGNTDRNDGNWLVDTAGRLTGIDHGMAFQTYRTPAQLVELVTGRNPFAGRLLEMDYQTHRVVGGTRAFTRADVEHVRAALQRLEGEFASLKRGAWFRQTMTRLNWLAKQAGDGEGTLFG
jgi:hypothetical protein